MSTGRESSCERDWILTLIPATRLIVEGFPSEIPVETVADGAVYVPDIEVDSNLGIVVKQRYLHRVSSRSWEELRSQMVLVDTSVRPHGACADQAIAEIVQL